MAAVPSIGRATLVEAARVAPQAAATQGLYERHAAKIQSYCMHQLGSREEAEDAVQTTFMNAFRALGRGVVPEAESAWLFKIAENVCLSRRRSSWRRGRIESPSDFDVIEEIVPGPNRQRDELIGIEDALASMPEQQRRAILLREWQGLSYREIAAELEVSQSAVETLIFRARRSLAQGLEQPDSIKPAKRKSFRRAMRVIDLGTIAAVVKGLVAGSAALKATAAAVAVTAAVGTAATVAPKQDSRTPASGLAQQAAPAATKPSGTPISFIPSAAPTSEQSSSVAVATPRAAAAQKPARAAGSGPARAPALPDAPATATPAASKPAQPSPAADQPKHDEPKHEATPRPTEPARADGNKNNEGKQGEGKQGEGKQHGQGPEATPAPAEPAAVAPVAPAPVASTPKRGGNSNGKDAPIVEATLPVIAAAPALADTTQGSKQDRGRGNPKRELTSAATAAAAPAAVVEVPEPASAPAPDPAAEATATPAPDSTPVAEADDQGNGKRKVK